VPVLAMISGGFHSVRDLKWPLVAVESAFSNLTQNNASTPLSSAGDKLMSCRVLLSGYNDLDG
jgi:hypothetical protein